MKAAPALSYALNNAHLRNMATYIRCRIEADASRAAFKANCATSEATWRAARAIYRAEFRWTILASGRRFMDDVQLGRVTL